MTSNEHYGMLNDRFDVRSEELRSLGMKYQHIPEWDTAMFWKPRIGKKIPITVPASFVMHADDICWKDRVEELKN